ncbi:hypothetical protein NUW58_g10585 [Xylaria curta]|uniref:Uncharacterized protein n=1 Tax=Xylaria curta TaxID=42375 RepID=A0ACC1MJD5_9PEZI|nr:hypothetical protein NUW58_g10585 [Xylaria curta]
MRRGGHGGIPAVVDASEKRIHAAKRRTARRVREALAQGRGELDAAGRRHVSLDTRGPHSPPHAGQKTILEIEEEIFDLCIERGVLACRGSWFCAEKDVEPTGLFFRTTFAAASQADMDVAIQRVGQAVRASFGV